ncbi:class I SAM-dependent methyltransferase [Phenylobacterium ferrooxidans]|uniref:Class I SAM-dependent methyltransferase n=1 Tax=Phenylobacterium ferrooxidans TaxID=2982689 RepID=A0ABW6CTR0_9CAUL
MNSNQALVLGLWRRIRRRIARTGLSLDMVAAGEAELTTVEADLPAYLWVYREVLGPWLASAAAAGDLADQLVRWLHRHNQFLYATAQTRAELGQVYAQALADTAELLDEARSQQEVEDGLPQLLAEHHQRLALALKVAFGARLRDTVQAEYSPALQIAVLGLDRVETPVLDVGCGATAALVDYLRNAGIEGVGMDRDAQAPGVVQADWLTQDYGRGIWGTVISHLGFSLHFLHHHLSDHELAFDYARAYMRILASLRVGGRFAYAPALPFLEAVLGDNYRVESRTFDGYGGGLPIESSTVVTRLA